MIYSADAWIRVSRIRQGMNTSDGTMINFTNWARRIFVSTPKCEIFSCKLTLPHLQYNSQHAQKAAHESAVPENILELPERHRETKR